MSLWARADAVGLDAAAEPVNDAQAHSVVD